MHYIANYRRLQLLLPYDFVLHYILYYITQYITLYYIFSLYGTFSLFLIKLTSTRLIILYLITLHNIIYMYYNKQHVTLQVHYIIIQSKLPKLPPLLSSHLLYAVTLFPPDEENSYIIAL